MSIIVYILGYIVAYILLKGITKRLDKSYFSYSGYYSMNRQEKWNDVICRIIISFLSWIGVAAIIIVWIVILTSKINRDPPKWL